MSISEMQEAIDKLTLEFEMKALEYYNSVKRSDGAGIKENLRLQLKELENQLNDLKEQMVVLVAAIPTNGKKS